jgi:hypothetical protein
MYPLFKINIKFWLKEKGFSQVEFSDANIVSAKDIKSGKQQFFIYFPLTDYLKSNIDELKSEYNNQLLLLNQKEINYLIYKETNQTFQIELSTIDEIESDFKLIEFNRKKVTWQNVANNILSDLKTFRTNNKENENPN